MKVIRLSEFVLSTVAKRRLPWHVDKPWTRSPTVLMKLDIEGRIVYNEVVICLPFSYFVCFLGSEIEVVPDLLLTGAFSYINATMIEWHERLAKLEERKKLSRELQVSWI